MKCKVPSFIFSAFKRLVNNQWKSMLTLSFVITKNYRLSAIHDRDIDFQMEQPAYFRLVNMINK